MVSSDCLQGRCSRPSVSLQQRLAYSLPVVPVYLLVGSLGVVHGIYAKYFGLSLATIATILLACRLFDAISDPLIGYWCDRYRTQTGSCKPFVMVGGVLLPLICYVLFVPSGNSGNEIHFLFFMIAWFFAFTLFEIPHLSLGSELIVDSQEKTGLYGLRTLGINIGLLLFYLVPFLPFFSSHAYNPQTLYWVIVAAAVLMVPALWIFYRTIPSVGPGSLAKPPRRQLHENLWSLRREIFYNKPLLIFLVVFFFYGVGTGMWFSLQFIFIDVYLGLGEYFSLVNIIGLCVSSFLVGFWVKLSNKIGKKQTWSVGLLVYILCIVIACQLKPEDASVVSLMWVMCLNYSGVSAVSVLAAALIADIIDYGHWKFGVDRAATYFSLLMLSVKTTAALGGALGLGVAGWYGFDPAAINHTSEQVFGLRLAAFWLPIPVLLITLMLIALIPMNGHRHRIIRRRLDAQAVQSSQPNEQTSLKYNVLSKDATLAS